MGSSPVDEATGVVSPYSFFSMSCSGLTFCLNELMIQSVTVLYLRVVEVSGSKARIAGHALLRSIYYLSMNEHENEMRSRACAPHDMVYGAETSNERKQY